MRVNPVHALVNLLRIEIDRASLSSLDGQKADVASLAPAAGKPASAPRDATAGDHPREDSEIKGLPISGRSSDVINTAKTEHHGRVWHFKAGILHFEGDDDRTYRPLHEDVRNIALPFLPTRDDMDVALSTGRNWPQEWGEGLRHYILRAALTSETQARLTFRWWIVGLLALTLLILVLSAWDGSA